MAERSYDPGAYGQHWAAIYDDEVRGTPPASLELLAELAEAGGGSVLELAVGTGRFAIPLAERGFDVHGIDVSKEMVRRLRAKRPRTARSGRVSATIADMADFDLDRRFGLVFLVASSFFLLCDQDDQVRCFEAVTRHLDPGGSFVFHGFVPDIGRFDRGQTVRTADLGAGGASIEAARHDAVGQRIDVQYLVVGEGGIETYPIALRYAWPAELDLMARVAGLRRRDRFGGWHGEPFTAASPEHVSVYVHAG